jgi:hypothetical protein
MTMNALKSFWLSVRPRKQPAAKIVSKANIEETIKATECKVQERAEVERLEVAVLKASISRLEARRSELQQARERRRFESRETLLYLPASYGGSYAEAEVAGGFLRINLREALKDLELRMEACRRFGVEPYLDKDHDFRTPMFMVQRFYIVETEGLYCSGCWTPKGLRLRPFFRGVSSAGIEYSKKFPPPAKYLMAKDREWKENKKNLEAPDVDFLGSLGCVCIDCYATWPATIHTSDPGPRVLEAINEKVIT